ncbi:MAG: 50S ribosomal protein L35 [Candidatus Blackburnbacteria bacterium]|nr:50S ribosomal protein L35 [Candidatus Blackburnbacteria bacterium]
MKKTKFKPKKALVRRFKVTGRGKLVRDKSFGNHLRAGKRKSRIRRLNQSATVTGKFERKVKQILGIA